MTVSPTLTRLYADATNLAAKRSPHGHPLPDSEIRSAWSGVDAVLAGLHDPKVREDLEHALGQVMLEHRYDYQNRGSKPEDPGWHKCTCPWEGYWFDHTPHVAHEQFTALVRMLGSGPRS